MKIIKKGNQNKNIMIFTCKACGCEFECNEDEYWEETGMSLSYPPQVRVVASCPSCHKICQSSKQYKVKDYNITLTGGTIDGDSFI